MGRLGDFARRALTAPLRVLLPKNRWLRLVVILLPVVLLLFLLEPAVDVALRLFELGGRLLEPLLQTTVGRVLLLLLVFVLGGIVTAWLLRSRVRDFRGRVVLGRHLQAVAALLSADRRRCRDQFRRVAKWQGPLPQEYLAVVQDANLKLARLALDAGRAEEAMRWLARIREPGLPTELRRSLRQLRVQALRAQGEALPETIESELRAAVDEFDGDYLLLRELRAVLQARGAVAEVAQLQEQVVKHAPPRALAAERQQLVADLLVAGEAALAADDLDAAKKLGKRLRSAVPEAPAGSLLLGKVLAKTGDLRGAIREWGGTRSPEGLDLVAELLAAHPGAIPARELLECCPMQGTLLLLAREFARDGDTVHAERAARMAAAALGPTPTVVAVLADVLTRLGKEQQAALLCDQAVQRLLQGHGAVRAAGA
jgi:hypothetical protein